ncbi:hypothetical protein [Haladaptatus sp.]
MTRKTQFVSTNEALRASMRDAASTEANEPSVVLAKIRRNDSANVA